MDEIHVFFKFFKHFKGLSVKNLEKYVRVEDRIQDFLVLSQSDKIFAFEVCDVHSGG